MFMGVNIILSTSLNLVNGNMGEFSCGHAGFMCVGAYVSSVLGVLLFTKDKVFGAPLLDPNLALYGFPFIILAGGVAAALAGLLVAIPSYKTRGDYLAIITIAANYIIISAIENMGIIGGSRGFMGMKSGSRAHGGSRRSPLDADLGLSLHRLHRLGAAPLHRPPPSARGQRPSVRTRSRRRS